MNINTLIDKFNTLANSLSTKEIKESLLSLNEDTSDEAIDVMDKLLEILSYRIEENEFVEFCDKLYAL